MATGPFTADQFVATEWSTAEDKAQFGNTFLRFVRSDFNRKQFTKPFYRRLSMCFSHIAHNDIFGFYNTWFERDVDRLGFLHHTLTHPCYGDPKFTFSDVERAIQIELARLDLVYLYEQRIEDATHRRELKELERLKQKYEPETSSIVKEAETQDPPHAVHTAATEMSPAADPYAFSIQGNLFE